MKNQQKDVVPVVFPSVLIIFVLLIANCLLLIASVPRTMNYQGKITDIDGIALDGAYDIEFKIYNSESGGSPVWTEIITVNVVNGMFDVRLGTTVPIDIDFTEPYWLELAVTPAGESSWETFEPREALSTVSYAFRSIHSDTARFAMTSPTSDGGNGLVSEIFVRQLEVCPGERLKLGARYAGINEPLTHAWTGDTGPLSATNIPDPVFTSSTPGDYHLTYTVTDDLANNAYQRIIVTVHTTPSPVISSYPSSGGCEGQPVILDAGGCYARYCWSPAGPNTRTFEVNAAGTYTVMVWDEFGCQGSDSITISFLPSPMANAGANVAVCFGTANPNVGGSPTASGGSPPYFYEWTGTGIPYLSSASEANPVFDISAASPGAYNLSVNIQDGNGCTDSDGPITVTIYNNPTASASSNSPVCIGEDINLNGTPAGGSTPYNYNWWGPNSFGSSEQNPTISGATAPYEGTYKLVVTDVHGCKSDTAVTVVDLLFPPDITVQPVAESECEGLNAGFAVTATGEGLIYQWQENDGTGFLNISGATSTSLTLTSITTDMDGYSYRCIVTGTCLPSDTSDAALLTVKALPNITVHPTPAETTLTDGDNITYSVTATGTGLTYQWQEDDGGGFANMPGETGSSLTLTSVSSSMSGYSYRCIVSGDCTPPDISNSVTINFYLYDFSSHTFTSCGASGRYGPTLSQCRSTYSTSWDENNAFFNMTSQGIQLWTVPRTGTYRITVLGAEGGRGKTNSTPYSSGIPGKGARMRGDFNLTQGEVIQIIVGQKGGEDVGDSYQRGGGGGGGSYVVKEDDTHLIIAGGGGGAGRYDGNNGVDGTTSTSGTAGAGTGGAGGTGGNGGSVHSCSYAGGSGAGFLTNGINKNSGHPLSFLNGGVGASKCTNWTEGNVGGFGGGGGTGPHGGGGGGGYSGGGGGGDINCGTNGGGGGGGSYNSGTSQSNSSGINTGNGSVTIELL